MRKWKWHLNSLFPCHRNTVGTKVHALLTFTWSCSSRKTKTTLWVQNVLNLPALKFKNSMINRYFKIPQITWFGGIVRLLEDKTEKLTCVCRWNFRRENCLSKLEINMPACTLYFIKTWSRPIKLIWCTLKQQKVQASKVYFLRTVTWTHQ